MHMLILAADAVPAQPVWLTVLLAVLPMLIGALVALHPLLKLSAWLHAKAEAEQANKLVRGSLLAAESLAKSLDHYLEISQNDAADLADPAKRAAALKHLEETAKSEALPVAADAVKALGSSWLTGAASQAIDEAMAKAPAAADAGAAGPQ